MQSKKLKKPTKTAKPKKEWMNTAKIGAIGELAFTLRASLKGLSVAEPCGAAEAYDRLVDNGKRCWRVQIKTAFRTKLPNRYRIECTHNTATGGGPSGKGVPYREDEIDFLAAYVLPEDKWYIVPWKALRGRYCFTIHSKSSRYTGNLAQYEEAWDLFWEGGKAEKADDGLITLMACAEEPAPIPGPGGGGHVQHPSGSFWIWTDGQPPAPDVVQRILEAMAR